MEDKRVETSGPLFTGRTPRLHGKDDIMSRGTVTWGRIVPAKPAHDGDSITREVLSAAPGSSWKMLARLRRL